MTTISQSSTIGIYLSSPSYTNPVVINSGATIATGGNAVYGFYGVWTIQNSGRIASARGNGIYLGAGGLITNLALASISGVDGVNIAGASGTVINGGNITGNTTASIGVLLAAGGAVTNQTGAAISG